MSKDDDWYWRHTYKEIDEKYRLKDVERENRIDRLRANSARDEQKDHISADRNIPRANTSEMDALTEMYRKRDDILSEISQCSELRETLKTNWSQRLTSINLALPDAESKLDALAKEVEETSKEEYYFYLGGGMISKAAVLKDALSLIGTSLDGLSIKAGFFQTCFR